MLVLEELEQDNYAKHDPGTERIWELDLAVLEGLECNNVNNLSSSKGDWYINGDMTFD